MEKTTDKMVDRELASALVDAIGWSLAAYRETGDARYLAVKEALFDAGALRPNVR